MARVKFGPFEFDPYSGQLWKFDHSIKLQPKSASVLAALLQKPGEVVTREHIRTRLWPEGVYVDFDRSINVAIKRLRDALSDSSDQPKYIATVPGQGYRFIAAVTTLSPIPMDESVPQQSRGRWPFLWAAIATVLIAGIGLFFALRHSPLQFHGHDWVLIAEFDNRTGEKVLDGVLDYALERELSNSQFAYVVPRERINDALRLMKKPADTKLDRATAREVCLRDGAIKAILTGRIEKIGTNYLLSAEVIDPARDVVVASLAEEDPADTLLARAVRRLSDRVRETLGESRQLIQESNEQLEKVTTPSLRALQLYSRAARLVDRGLLQNEQIAALLLQQALQEDPNFASAQLLLGYAYLNQGLVGEAAPHFRRAFELADTTSERERYFILASYYGEPPVNQLQKAAELYETLLRLYPDHPWAANNLANVYGRMGQRDIASELRLRVAALRPNNFDAQVQAAWAMYNRVTRLFLLQPRQNEAWTEADFAPARAYLKRAIAIFEKQPEAAGDAASAPWELSAEIDWAEGNFVASHADVVTAEQHGKEAADYFGLGYAAFGNLAQAEKRSASDPLSLALLADFKGEEEQAGEYLRKINFSGDANPGEDGLAAILWARGKNYRQAQAMYREFLADGRTVANQPAMDVMGSTATIELALAKGVEGIPNLEKVAAKDRMGGSQCFQIASYDLARAYVSHHRSAAAIRVLEQAGSLPITLNNLSAAWQERNQLLLAKLYRQTGRDHDATRLEHILAEKLAFADPDNPLAQQLAAISSGSVTTAAGELHPVKLRKVSSPVAND